MLYGGNDFTKESRDVLDALSGKDDRVSYCLERGWRTNGAVWNKGLSVAGGKFVMFLGGNDVLAGTHALSSLVNAARSEGYPVCGGLLSYENPLTIEAVEYERQERRGCFKTSGVVEYGDYQFDGGLSRYVFNHGFIDESRLSFTERGFYDDNVFVAKALARAERFLAISDTVCLRANEDVGKRVPLTEVECKGLVDNLGDLLDVSRENGWAKLHAETFRRFKETHFVDIRKCLELESVMSSVARANARLSGEMLDVSSVVHTSNQVLPPLSACCETIRNGRSNTIRLKHERNKPSANVVKPSAVKSPGQDSSVGHAVSSVTRKARKLFGRKSQGKA